MIQFIFCIIILIINIIEFGYICYKLNKKNEDSNKIVKANIQKRVHSKLAKASFSSPLDPYEQYKDKNSKLYEPRKPNGGIRIEVDKK